MAGILVVDDSRLQRRLLARQLEASGHRVHAARDLREVRSIRHGFRPELTLVELLRFRGNGFSLAESLMQSGCGIVVLLSARGLASDRLWARARGIPCLLERPANPASLCRSVDRILREYGSGS